MFTRRSELICGLNQAFISGILNGIGGTALRAELARVRLCCVWLAPAA